MLQPTAKTVPERFYTKWTGAPQTDLKPPQNTCNNVV